MALGRVEKRGRFQFGLSTMLLLILGLGIVLGFIRWVAAEPSIVLIVGATICGALVGGSNGSPRQKPGTGRQTS